jgi:hypothetical protein
MSLINEPQNPGWWQIVWKTFIWLTIGAILALLVFAIMYMLWSSFFMTWDGMFMSLVFVIIWCIVTIIWVWVYSGLLNLVFGSDYYDFAKMFGFSVLANWLLVILFLPIYLMMSDSLDILLLVLAFHVMFGFFISYSLIEITTNPNYAASNIVWSMLGFWITLLVYISIYKTIDSDITGTTTLYIYILSPFLLAYTITPLCHGIWTQIYYGIYTGWNNPLFVPQLADVIQIQNEVDEVTVEVS